MGKLGEALKSSAVNSANLITLNDKDLKRMQENLYAMLIDIKDVCKKENIKWGLIAGSLLGAVRYNDFIPWDDDIDIYMLRSEYERFKSVFNKELGDKYVLKQPGDPNYIFHFPQIQKKGTRLQLLESPQNDDSGLFIDLFIYDNVCDNILAKTLHGLECTILLFIDSALRMKECSYNIFKYCSSDEVVHLVNARAFWAVFFEYKSFESWLKLSDNVFGKVKKEGKLLVNPSGAKHFFGEMYHTDQMKDITWIQFRDTKLPVPKGYKYYLRERYGENYMIPPDVNAREAHKYIKVEI